MKCRVGLPLIILAVVTFFPLSSYATSLEDLAGIYGVVSIESSKGDTDPILQLGANKAPELCILPTGFFWAENRVMDQGGEEQGTVDVSDNQIVFRWTDYQSSTPISIYCHFQRTGAFFVLEFFKAEWVTPEGETKTNDKIYRRVVLIDITSN